MGAPWSELTTEGGGWGKGSHHMHARVSPKLHCHPRRNPSSPWRVVRSGGCECEEGTVTGEANGGGAQGRGRQGGARVRRWRGQG
jgi:hypothetical protein